MDAAPRIRYASVTHQQQGLSDWVASGTRLDRDRPTRQTTWPGEDSGPVIDDVVLTDRSADFEAFVTSDVARRQAAGGRG